MYIHIYIYIYTYHIETICITASLPQYHENYLRYIDATCALDYKWTGIMDIETLLFLIEDAVTGCTPIV